MNTLSCLLLIILIDKASAASCIPNDFKEQCLNITLTPGYKSTYFDGYCWVLDALDLQDWNTAMEKCKTDYKEGRLAFITSRNELDAIKTVFDLGLGAWSGFLRDPAQAIPNGWQYMNSDSALAYAKDPLDEWAPGSPMPVALEDVAAITNDGYIQRNALMILQYLCQFPEPPSCPTKACFDAANKDSKAAASMGNVTIDVFTDVNIHRCRRLCAELPECQSFGHNKDTKQCELYWLPVEALTLEAAAGFDMFDRNPNHKNCEVAQDCFDVCSPAVSSGDSASYNDQSFPDGSFVDQTQLTLTCDADKRYVQGTTANTVAASTCNAPNWTPNDMECQPVCDPISPNPSGGTPTYNNQSYSDGSYPDQTQLTLSCDADKRYIQGTTASKLVVSRCNAPDWSSNDMNCAPGKENFCQPFTLTAHQTATYSQSLSDGSIASGEAVTLECDGIRALFVNGVQHAGRNIVVNCTAPNWAVTDIECGGHILIFGGYDTSAMSPIESFYPEDPSSNQVEANLNPGRYGVSAGVVAEKVVIAGGASSTAFQQSTTIYDPVTKTFTAAPDMSGIRRMGEAALMDGILYNCGGDTQFVNLATCEKFMGGTWVTMPSMTTPRWRHAVVALNGKVYAIAGDNGGARFSSVERYDPATATWTAVNDLPVATHRHDAATLDGYIYVCGGRDDIDSINRCYKYSDVTDTWTQVASMNKARLYPLLVEIGGRLIALGGEDSSGQTSVEIYDPDADTWTMHTDELIHMRYVSAAVVVK